MFNKVIDQKIQNFLDFLLLNFDFSFRSLDQLVMKVKNIAMIVMLVFHRKKPATILIDGLAKKGKYTAYSVKSV